MATAKECNYRTYLPWQQAEKAMSIIGFWTILRFYGNNLGEKTASYWACHLLPDDVWEVNFQKFFSLDVIPGIDVPVMNEAAFESWSDDEPTVSSLVLLLVLVRNFPTCHWLRSNVSRASTSAMVPSSGRSPVSTDGDTLHVANNCFTRWKKNKYRCKTLKRVQLYCGINVSCWNSIYSQKSLIRTSVIRIFTYPNPQNNDIYRYFAVH